MTLVLSADEVQALTGYKRSDAQARQLDHMRIPYRLRADGSPVVLTIHVTGHSVTLQDREPEVQP